MRALPGWAVIEVEEKRMEGSLELPDSAKSDMQQGTIIAVNPYYPKEGAYFTVDGLEEGIRVAFKKYHENDLAYEGKKYKVVHCDHLMVILDDLESND